MSEYLYDMAVETEIVANINSQADEQTEILET